MLKHQKKTSHVLENDSKDNEKAVSNCHEKSLYTISIDSNSKINVNGVDGARLRSEELKLPISLGENAQLLSVMSANFWEIKGSHYIIVEQSGRLFKYYLPH